ncbi:Amino acid/polyamine transporter I [Metarhizium album ARSEF 1941]|uniref:Amino acid/polyamine transporter I n=1 Tax=Metarhizium album (strain ARSEF 1941) TaxID=1081103 RepID=A0A0B2WLW6_METAS|nr:Amino acid/polyamine transporter I [Metarhizium album ARSEF 1941]KHN94010.1 Amino acid/polyamine transporter I [Metarhizium album ARSEF 1941]
MDSVQPDARHGPHGSVSTPRHGEKRRGGTADDAARLEAMGHRQELKRNFSMLSMLGLAFAILNTWTALAASITLALPSGGSSSVIWGLVVAGLARRVPLRVSHGRYVTGWINVCGWVALSATGPLLGSTFLVNTIALFNPSYDAKPWHQFLIYVGFALVALVINALLTRLLPYFTRAAFFWSMTGFVVVVITVLSCASPHFQPGDVVYGQFINNVGWPDGLAWLLGLLQGAFALTGFDATAHMIEEIPDPQHQGPKIMLSCIGIGMVTGFIFLSGLLFSVDNIDNVLGAAWGPLLEIFMQATKSKAGSTCLLVFPLLCMVFTTTTLMCTSTRMSYAFARDGGMPFSRFFSRVHSTLEVPLNALFWTVAWVIVFGCIFLGSSSTFNAIAAASVVALGLTYAIPPAVHLARGRNMLPDNRPFKLPGALGWVLNLVGILWTALTTVLFVFPPAIPVTASNMNYCIVAFGVMLLIAGGTWVLDGRKHYRGPQLDVQGLIDGKAVEGMEPAMAVDSSNKTQEAMLAALES